MKSISFIKKRDGFTLLEIMIVTVIIGILSSIALPASQKVYRSSKHARFMNDLRTFKDALNICVFETGNPDQGSGTGTLAAEFSSFVSNGKFTAETSIGGNWDVEYNKSGIGFGLGVHRFDASNSELQAIDERFDDGDLSTGNLQKIAGDRYYWVIQQALF